MPNAYFLQLMPFEENYKPNKKELGSSMIRIIEGLGKMGSFWKASGGKSLAVRDVKKMIGSDPESFLKGKQTLIYIFCFESPITKSIAFEKYRNWGSFFPQGNSDTNEFWLRPISDSVITDVMDASHDFLRCVGRLIGAKTDVRKICLWEDIPGGIGRYEPLFEKGSSFAEGIIQKLIDKDKAFAKENQVPKTEFARNRSQTNSQTQNFSIKE